MTDTEKLQRVIIRSGYKKEFLADKLGITVQSLLNKITNRTEFNATQIESLCELLSIDVNERMAIFFKSELTKSAKEEG